MAIGKGKARYSVTLTPGNVERFQRLVREFGMPSNTMSKACDDVIRDLCGVFEEAKQKGSFGLDDLFRVMGTQMQLLMEEERKSATPQKKRRPHSDR